MSFLVLGFVAVVLIACGLIYFFLADLGLVLPSDTIAGVENDIRIKALEIDTLNKFLQTNRLAPTDSIFGIGVGVITIKHADKETVTCVYL